MDKDRGIFARIDRKLLAGLCDDEALRTLRVPATAAKWSTWKRYCDAAGISMGRAVAMLIDGELISVFGEHTAGEWPAFAQRAAKDLENREARIEAREHKVDTDEARMNERSERLRRWEGELEARELRAEFSSKIATRYSADRAKIGRNERCPCGSGLNVAGSYLTHDSSCRLGSEQSTSKEDPLPFDALTLRLCRNAPTQRGKVVRNLEPESLERGLTVTQVPRRRKRRRKSVDSGPTVIAGSLARFSVLVSASP